MAALAPICRGYSRPIILFRSSFQSIKPYNQTTRVSQWLQPSCARIYRRSFAMKVPPPNKTTVGKTPPKSPKLALGKKPANAAPHPVKQPVVPPPAKDSGALQQDFAQSLAMKSEPTTLYEVAPQKMFLFSSYLACFSCLIGAATNIILNVYNIPEGMHWIVPIGFGAAGIAMAVLGTRFALVPAGVVRSIKVLPARSIKNPNPAATAASPSGPPVRLQVEVRRVIPFMYKRFEVDPQDIVMPAPLYNVAEHHLPDETLLPSVGMFKNFRRGLTGEGFAPITIKDVDFKLDITLAYVLHGGRALDRIVRIERSPLLERLAAERKGR